MKKLIKLLTLYILFGLGSATAISLFGGFKSLIIFNTMGAMSLLDYGMLFLYVTLLWLPGCFGILMSKWNYIRLPFFKPVIFIIILLYIILTVKIIIEKEILK